jgi:hypothetical protein
MLASLRREQSSRLAGQQWERVIKVPRNLIWLCHFSSLHPHQLVMEPPAKRQALCDSAQEPQFIGPHTQGEEEEELFLPDAVLAVSAWAAHCSSCLCEMLLLASAHKARGHLLTCRTSRALSVAQSC